MKKMTAAEIDKHIMACPYFSGKDTIDRKVIDNEKVHVGSCGVSFTYDKICPSSECACAEYLGLG